MIWTNVFAALIASAMAVASSATGSFWPNVELLLTSGSLIWDVCVFSAASAVGLIILLNTIASFGALTSSLIMTIRQFLSILINAGIFGNFSSVSLVGWTGVFWVASGIWIKINKKYDPPKQSKTIFDATSASEENQGMLEKETFDQQKKSNKLRQYAMQYLLPIVLPVVGAILLAPFMATVGQPRVPTASENVAEKTIWAPVVGTNTDSVATVVNPVELGAMESPSNGLAAIVGSSSYDDDANSSTVNSDLNTDTTETPTASDKAAEDALNLVEASEAAALAVSIEGGRWDEELHNAMGPTCKTELVAHAYDAKMSTGFVSYPRSGNSYLRSLIERATGYQTSSIYCDKGLQQTFVGECNHQLQFFVKTHFPALPRIISPDNQDYQDYYKRFDQVVHVGKQQRSLHFPLRLAVDPDDLGSRFLLVRNPLDAVASWWHLSHVGRTPEGFQNHEGKVDIDKFGDEHRASILDLAERWRRHSVYWAQAPVLTHTLRYEDLKAQPIPHVRFRILLNVQTKASDANPALRRQMMSLISYLLPDEDLPPLADIACIAEHDEKLQAYHSRRSSDFATWDKYEPSLREELLSVVRRPFCAFGYQHVLRNAKGDVPE
ncbi:SPOSA6832_02813 [Sporobolomyces salmonicolor]|uniref:SPOSA6832_02813-mRNA-1:cds n=1 Tax=Sporidiobolus salmonicolor TaxID=5005 RepID=A0A0D6EMF5_SPOSA|nr:SPOSA6832_02813 [Sporobolomyces salmonicolor]